MKKVLVALVLVALLVSLCACSVVPSNSFMSKSKVNSLVKHYPEPKAVVTLEYTTGGNKFKVEITYKLLLDKAPIAVTRFIQIANEGGYENTLVDTVKSSSTSKKYAIMGRYANEQNTYYNLRANDVKFAGEFESNGYREPQGGYAKFKIFSLAMYHGETGEDFDSADGTLILALEGADHTLNPANYAVFAEFESMAIYTNGELTTPIRTTVSGDIQAHLKSFTGVTTRTVHDGQTADAKTSEQKITSTEVKLSVTIADTQDGWSKLPTIR